MMRPVFAASFLFLAAASGASLPSASRATLLLQFDSTHAESSIQEMKREVAAIMLKAGLSFEFRLLKEVSPADDFSDLIVIKFKGRCRMDPAPVLLDERGPLAFTHQSDGEMLPFSEVACDRVRVSVRSAMWGGDHARGDVLLGRALGRVLAHELYHIVSRTRQHAKTGVAQTALSGADLISERLDLTEKDLERLYHK